MKLHLWPWHSTNFFYCYYSCDFKCTWNVFKGQAFLENLNKTNHLKKKNVKEAMPLQEVLLPLSGESEKRVGFIHQ